MKKDISVDYLQAMRDFDKSLGRKPDDFDIPLRDSVISDDGVDYLAVSREYEWHQEQDHSDAVRGKK